MPSIVPGYSYDIFISYRHNDNRSGWVTEFVKALQEELAVTIKEPVSVYFDTNPHDGLLETHNVDKSLEGKLKCLIFIPIISQTYCDTKSFAWQHEFCAFNKLVKEDQFARDIKLSNGNVAGRILPVKIHDVDADDKTLLENELSGVLRAIEFIYKEAGVNRPLNSKEENSAKNQNQTVYRNQVNKLANAIKEILHAIRNPSASITINHPVGLPDPHEILDSIAVLPFTNMSSDPEQEYFSDGITEEILNALAQLSNLKVAGRTSSFQFKNKNPDLRAVGNKLNVSTVLEGSVRRQGNKLRITVQLIKVEDGFHLWSERYDRMMDDIFAIQDEIASSIVDKLKITLLDKDRHRINKSHTKNTVAYDLYLKGSYELRKTTPEGIRNGMDLYKKAIQVDSSFSLAYAGLSTGYLMLASVFIAELTGKEAAELSKPYLDKALLLDPHLAEAHQQLAFYTLYHDWDFINAEKEYRRAHELNPGNSVITSIYVDFLNFIKKHDQALRFADEQLEKDPYFPGPRKALCLYYLNRHQEAIDFQRARIEQSNSYPHLFTYGFVTLSTGNFAEAIESLSEAMDIAQHRLPRILGWMGAAYAKLGRQDKANELLNELKERRKNSNAGSPNFFIAVIYAGLGEKELALEWLTKAYEEHDWEMPWLITEPQFYPLHDDPRFKNLVNKMNFPE
ncbi:MAG: hypothetical protein AABY93_14500 [Bacteroidota bacterium]